jgi:hypothetical protein
MRSADGPDKFICRDILEQVGNRSGFQRVLDQVPLFEAGQCNDLNLWELLADSARCGYSVHIWHDHIHQDHIWKDFTAKLDSRCTAFSLARQFQVIEGFQEER